MIIGNKAFVHLNSGKNVTHIVHSRIDKVLELHMAPFPPLYPSLRFRLIFYLHSLAYLYQ